MSIKCRACNAQIPSPNIKFKDYPLSLWPCPKNLSNKVLDLNLYYCKKCTLIQLQRFKNKTIKSFYVNDSKVLNNDNLLQKRFKIIKNYVSIFKKNKLLEIGGGRNNILKFFSRSEKWICDFDIEKVNKDINIINTDFKNFHNKKKYFDNIFFFHTLEHIEDPKNFLINVSNKLKDNGKIILEVPNIEYYLKEYPYYAFFFQHQSLFSLKSLKNLLNICNLKFDKVISKQNDSFILGVISKTKNKKKLYKGKNIIFNIHSKIDKRIRLIKKFILKKDIKKIAMYGCGGASMTFFYHLKKNNIKIENFYDNDLRKKNLFIPKYDKKVINGNKFKSELYDLIITTNNSIKSFLHKKNKNINIISFQ